MKLVPIGVDHVQGAAQIVARPNIPPPRADAHKYTRGLCAIVAGDMQGATLLASQAAMRAGAGYVRLMSDTKVAEAPAGLVIDSRPLEISLSDPRIAAILVGPGLGRGDSSKERLRAALAAGVPTILDADALVLLTPEMLPEQPQILATPHDGELDQLCQSFAIVASDRQGKAQALAKRSGMTILAKGPDSLVATPDGRLALASSATSWLSTAGTGDVLAGIATSRIATGSDPFDAACEAVWLHGEAARLLGAAFTADDLASAVSQAVAAAG